MDSYRKHELPETTAKYSRYTRQFTEWLARTAAQRGLELAAMDDAHRAEKGLPKKQYKIPLLQLIPIAQGIADANVPLDDTSGLDDLNDAIRSRKEVTEYHRARGSGDEAHPFAIKQLVQVYNILKPFLRRRFFREHDVEDERPNHVNAQGARNDPPDSDDSEEEEEDKFVVIDVTGEELDMSDSFRWSHQKIKKRHSAPSKDPALTKEELEQQRDFKVLCFIYEYDQIRRMVQQAWRDYKERNVNLVTASLVTDLALGIVQRNVDTLVEDLPETGSGSFIGIVKKLHDVAAASSTPQLAELYCLEAIRNFDEYQRLKAAVPHASSPTNNNGEFRFLKLLLFFDKIRDKTFVVPEMDNFTEAMFRSVNGREPWLPFGLQILLDTQFSCQSDEEFQGQCRDVWNDVIEEAFALSDAMKTHIQYEDDMWKIGVKPDYMSQGETKFSNYFLPIARRVIEWVSQLVNDGTLPGSATSMTKWEFLAANPVMGGLATYHFQKVYQATSIAKVAWFVVALSHLYNAARQIGGLDVAWPDLDFIIKKHGSNRVFVADPPTDPSSFRGRLSLAMNTSAKQLAKDRRGKKWNKASAETKKRRGLMPHFPLQQKIRDYYSPDPNGDRWIRLHNLFAHIFKDVDVEVDPNDIVLDEERKKTVDTFTSFAASTWPSIPAPESSATPVKKKRSNGKKKPQPITTPDFQTLESEHVPLLSKMKIRLREDELHSGFDYLSFYRRAFAFIIHIRSEVLHDSQKELARLGSKKTDPNNYQLLLDLFESFKIKPKPKKSDEVKGDEISTEVVAVDQLQKISKILADLIREEGREELNKAEKALRRWYDAVEPQTPLPKPKVFTFIKRSDGIYHRMMFSSTVTTQRKAAIGRRAELARLSYPVKVKMARPRLVGRSSKHRIAFKCHWKCCMIRGLLGKEGRLDEQWRKMRVDPGLWEGLEKAESVSEFESDFEDAKEEL